MDASYSSYTPEQFLVALSLLVVSSLIAAWACHETGELVTGWWKAWQSRRRRK
jgi:hypothetical protein